MATITKSQAEDMVALLDRYSYLALLDFANNSHNFANALKAQYMLKKIETHIANKDWPLTSKPQANSVLSKQRRIERGELNEAQA